MNAQNKKLSIISNTTSKKNEKADPHHSQKLSITSSLIIAAAAVLFVMSLHFPWWRMLFIAPQYPEGLNIIVYPNKLEGQIDIINGLNHYIGMKNFSAKNFPELSYLSYLGWGLAAFTALTAILRKKAVLYILIAGLVLGGILGVLDLHKALHDFGTNLSPHAPIKIAPFVPPILGQNRVANFITHSLLGPGAYFLLAGFVLLLIPLWKDRKK